MAKDTQSLQYIALFLSVIVIVAGFLLGYNLGKYDAGMLHDGGGSEKVTGGNAQELKGIAGKGSEDAPVLIEEWSDFECPYCTRFYEQTLPQIEEQYIDTGKVRFVFKDFPLSFHANAQKAAEAGKCALAQGEFWAMHDKIFDMAGAGQKPTVDNLKLWAVQLGLDAGEFNTCLDSGQMASKVQAEFQEGQQKGIRGTPGFLINGELLSGAQPFSAFQTAIDKALAE